MSWFEFFKDEVARPRIPRSLAEGIFKGLLLGVCFTPCDYLFPTPEKGYTLLFFIILGTLYGLTGKYLLPDNQHAKPQPR